MRRIIEIFTVVGAVLAWAAFVVALLASTMPACTTDSECGCVDDCLAAWDEQA